MKLVTRGGAVSKGTVLSAIVLMAGAAALVAAWPQLGGFRAWIAEVQDGDDDWGWDLLGAEAQAAYDDDRNAYLADMTTAEWASLDLGTVVDALSDDGFVRVEAELRSDPATVPSFLLDRRIVHGVCHGRQPIAIGVYEDRRPFQRGAFGGGGLTGGQRRCNAGFTEAGE